MNTRTMTALYEYAEKNDTGAQMNWGDLTRQMGVSVLAISGGRHFTHKSTTIFPVSNGYYVTVTLTAADDYTVRLIFVRSGKIYVHEEATGIYAGEIGEVAYEASCFAA